MKYPIYNASFVKTIRELKNGQSHTLVCDNSRATVKCIEDKLYISPTDSLSFVYVRGRRIYEPTLIRKNDIITIGSKSLYTRNPERIPHDVLIQILSDFVKALQQTESKSQPTPPEEPERQTTTQENPERRAQGVEQEPAGASNNTKNPPLQTTTQENQDPQAQGVEQEPADDSNNPKTPPVPTPPPTTPPDQTTDSQPQKERQRRVGVSFMILCAVAIAIAIILVACALLASVVVKQAIIKKYDGLMVEAIKSVQDFSTNYNATQSHDQGDLQTLNEVFDKIRTVSNSHFYRNSENYRFNKAELDEAVQKHFTNLINKTLEYVKSEESRSISQEELDVEIEQWFQFYSDTPYSAPFGDLQSVWSVYNKLDAVAQRALLPIFDALQQDGVNTPSNALEACCLLDLHNLTELCQVEDLPSEIDEQAINFRLIASEGLLWRMYAYERLFHDRSLSLKVPSGAKEFLGLDKLPKNFAQLVKMQLDACERYINNDSITEEEFHQAALPLKETLAKIKELQ
ncbi:MAG: hypothetical protein Q4G03_10360 [Planctomycetia bacterium]|nr:hypothetical protein [Planctomycetia bacterium]